jgi:hypothetical protein
MGTIMKKLGVCIAALATTALTRGFAHGADIPLAPAYPAPVIPAVPIYTGTGIALNTLKENMLRGGLNYRFGM